MALTALRQAAVGRGTTLMVVGEAGMGKTRYAETVLAGAEHRGWHTLRGRARAAGAELPYHAVVEALDPLLLERPDLVARLSSGSRAALAALTPAVTDAEAPASVGRHRVLAAIGHLLREAALDRGVVLVLEDLHVADEATLQLVDFLAGGARREPLLIVATTRPAGGGAGLRAALLDHHNATEVALGPLADAAIHQLTAPGLPDATARAIVDAAAGNPFYALELTRAVEPSGRIRIPDRLQSLLDARLAVVPDDALPALAVLEDGFTAAEFAAVADRAKLPPLDVLERDGSGWRFAHPLLREAARRRTPPDALRRAHADAAAALGRAGGAPKRIAYHLLEAEQGAKAVPHLIAAARHAATVGAFADGQRWVEQALRHADGRGSGALHALLGDLRFATGDRAALVAYAEATRLAGRDEEPDVRARYARAAMSLGELDVAEQAVTGLPAGTVAQRARGTVILAMLAWYRGRIEQAERLVDQAEALGAAAATDVELLADVRAMIGHASGRWEAQATLELGDSWHIAHLAGHVFDAYLCVTEYVLHAGDPYERLIGFAEELRSQARRTGARRGEAFSCTVLGEAHLLRGDVEAARTQLELAARLSREVGAVGGRVARSRAARGGARRTRRRRGGAGAAGGGARARARLDARPSPAVPRSRPAPARAG